MTGSVRFWFYKSETEKTEPNPNKKKPSQTGKNQVKPENRAKLIWVEFCSKITEPNWNWSVWTGFGFKKKIVLIIFFDKNRTKLKIITFTYNGFHHLTLYNGSKKKTTLGQNHNIIMYFFTLSHFPISLSLSTYSGYVDASMKLFSFKFEFNK